MEDASNSTTDGYHLTLVECESSERRLTPISRNVTRASGDSDDVLPAKVAACEDQSTNS